ncbi:hypothetical protein NC651_015428 [Populus alba x Populus x berolinensis]|nr:hypothetical protein NC651_015428 [Populus alba x Populus x berolinensis]
MSFKKKKFTLPPIIKALDKLPSPPPQPPLPPLPKPPPTTHLAPLPTLTLTPTSNHTNLLHFLNSHLTKIQPLTPQNLLHFFKTKLHHHPHFSHCDFHIFNWVSTIDSFSHDHQTFEWMARTLAITNRLEELALLLQFMSSNPCPCSEGIFSCPRIEPIFQFCINAYCKARKLDDALLAFECMRKLIDGRPSVVVYNILINGCVKCGEHDRAIGVYDRMLKDRVKPDVFTFNILISSYCRNYMFELALELFREMKEKGCSPNVVSFNTLIKGFFRERKFEEGVKMVYEMIDLGCEISSVTFEILVDGLCKEGQASVACGLLIDFTRKGVLPRKFDSFGLVDMLCKKRMADRALEVLDELWRNGNIPSMISCTTLIEGLRKSGRREEAFGLMERMLKENIVPDIMTFNCLLHDLCNEGRTVDGNKLRLLASRKGLDVDEMTYDILVSGCTREGKRKEGEALVDEMLDKEFIPDLATYNRFIDGLSKTRSSAQYRNAFFQEMYLVVIIFMRQRGRRWGEEMVNPFTGPDSTASHFFIAAKKFLLDGKRVTFGKVSRGTDIDLTYWHVASEGIISLKVSSWIVGEVLRGETWNIKLLQRSQLILTGQLTWTQSQMIFLGGWRKILLKIELITVEDCLGCLQILLPLSELLHASTKLCFCINRSRYDDDDYINLCHKISWLPQVLLSFTVPSRLYILLVQGFLLADFALENINIYKAAKFLERQARKT